VRGRQSRQPPFRSRSRSPVWHQPRFTGSRCRLWARSVIPTGARSRRSSASSSLTGVRPILEQLRTLAGFLFFRGLPVSPGGEKSNLGENRKCRRSFKSSAEHSKQPAKIENCGRKLKSSAERWVFRRKFKTATRTIEKLRRKSTLALKICGVRGKFKSPAGERTSPAKIWIVARKFKFPADRRRRFRRIEKFSGGLSGPAEEEKVSLENRSVPPKIQIAGGKRSRRPEN